LANNRDVGRVVQLGSFPAGTELVFGIKVVDTGYTYKIGAAARNPDGIEHAFVQADPDANTARVRFEDLFGGGDRSFTDTVFTFRGALEARTFPLSVDPAISSPEVGTSASFTAELLDRTTSAPVPNVTLRAAITGPNSSSPLTCISSCVTGTAGKAVFSYRGVAIGEDRVLVYADLNANNVINAGEPQTTALVRWKERRLAPFGSRPDFSQWAVGDVHTHAAGDSSVLSNPRCKKNVADGYATDVSNDKVACADLLIQRINGFAKENGLKWHVLQEHAPWLGVTNVSKLTGVDQNFGQAADHWKVMARQADVVNQTADAKMLIGEEMGTGAGLKLLCSEFYSLPELLLSRGKQKDRGISPSIAPTRWFQTASMTVSNQTICRRSLQRVRGAARIIPRMGTKVAIGTVGTTQTMRLWCCPQIERGHLWSLSVQRA
jgi:hypothetical protein